MNSVFYAEYVIIYVIRQQLFEKYSKVPNKLSSVTFSHSFLRVFSAYMSAVVIGETKDTTVFLSTLITASDASWLKILFQGMERVLSMAFLHMWVWYSTVMARSYALVAAPNHHLRSHLQLRAGRRN